ncbi:ABC transporter substrate-binding protein [Paenibacillus aceris]|uniref:Aldouronate transport system substrate-binding protein n=1 Tax=Paenibacillus aceris TaxID=869555 RepID=A0ABS4HS96_9BACL|nr:ABC transporter substrate-binding protein [Paenibacillus aceris]MBP1960894.1 putative aldouronate transport system substrate-binding protein [Paenibacillus aceris]
MKKIWGMGLSMLVASGVVLGGCGDKQADAPAETAKEAVTASNVTAAGELPITKEKTTLKVLVKGFPGVSDYANNEFTKYLEEKTNIHIEWTVAPEKSAVEKLNLVLGSGDLPDVIMGFGISPTQQLIYGTQGDFLDLAPYINKYGVETKKMFDIVQGVKDEITAPGGKIYALPQVNECYHCSMSQKMWIYQPWLDKLGLQMPKTTDDLYNVLKAFKTKDPNGNGKADEIPLAGAAVGPAVNIDSFIMNSFVLDSGITTRLYVDNGKITTSVNTQGWKEGLAYLHKLYAEGLIAPQSFTQDRDQAKAMGENPDINILGSEVSQHNGIFTTFSGPSGRWLQVQSVPSLKGPAGVQTTPWKSSVLQGYYVVTRTAKNPDAAFRLGDLLYNTEMTLRQTIGRPGTEWDYAANGEIGINGKQAIWKSLPNAVPTNAVNNINWSGQSAPSLRSNDFRLGQMADPKNPLEVKLFTETKNNYEPYKQKPESVLPALFFSNEQATELADLEKTLTDYINQMIARFTTGDANLDKEWDSYVKKLNDMNLKKYLDIYQAAYDAKMKK